MPSAVLIRELTLFPCIYSPTPSLLKSLLREDLQQRRKALGGAVVGSLAVTCLLALLPFHISPLGQTSPARTFELLLSGLNHMGLDGMGVVVPQKSVFWP